MPLPVTPGGTQHHALQMTHLAKSGPPSAGRSVTHTWSSPGNHRAVRPDDSLISARYGSPSSSYSSATRKQRASIEGIRSHLSGRSLSLRSTDSNVAASTIGVHL